MLGKMNTPVSFQEDLLKIKTLQKQKSKFTFDILIID